jgi:hypothetical protein
MTNKTSKRRTGRRSLDAKRERGQYLMGLLMIQARHNYINWLDHHGFKHPYHDYLTPKPKAGG